MHHNDLNCGEIVDKFCYIPKSFCYIKKRMGAMLANLGLLFRIWAEMKSNGHNSTTNGFCDP